MKQLLYCIKHECMDNAGRVFDTIPIEYPDGTKDARVVEIGLTHSTFTPAYLDEPPQGDWCGFDEGWATCPPPELKPDWIDGVVEPSQAEIDIININAYELAQDFLA